MRSDAQTTAKPIASAEEVLAAAGRAASLGLRSTSLSKMPEKSAQPAQAKKAGQENDPIEEEDLDDSVCGVCFNGDSVEGNEILFCEKCEVPIHLVSNPPLLHSQLALVLRVCVGTVTA